MDTYRCTTCKKEKPISDFWKDRGRKSGLRHMCKECDSTQFKYVKIKRVYGLSKEEADEIYSRGCEVCGTKEGKLCIDHCHDTRKVRGCLCDPCNKALGLLKNCPKNIRFMLDYITRTKS